MFFNSNIMASHILCQVCCILLLCNGNVHATESNRVLEAIHFVVINGNGSAVTLGPGASVSELQSAIAVSYNVSFPFELRLFGETIVSSLVSSRSSTNQLLRGIPSIVSIVNDLDEIWGPGFRIPLKMYPVTALEHDSAVYASLVQMFGGPDSNIYEFEWYQFVLHCLETRSCLIQDVCGPRFEKRFLCEYGKIKVISLESQFIRGHLNLSAIPRTVRIINLRKNALTTILGLDQLAGKELMWLDVRQNPLEIDLKMLQSTPQRLESSPLKVIQINHPQIMRSLIGEHCKYPRKQCARFYEKVYEAAIRWIETSTLDSIVFGRSGHFVKRQKRGRMSVRRIDRFGHGLFVLNPDSDTTQSMHH